MSRAAPSYDNLASMDLSPSNDAPTIIAISALAYIIGDLLHEAVGHGVTAWLSGAHRITVSTVALQSDIDTRWIAANGTLMNFLAAVILWILLLRPQRYRPATLFFLVILLAGNLFTATGYFLFSGITNFGDWAVVIAELRPLWAWRLALTLFGFATYYASMLLVASKLRPFQGPDARRLRSVCWTPYFTDAILATLAGISNPAGLFYVIASALPSTLGAKAGLLSLPSMMRHKKSNQDPQVISLSTTWILTSAMVSAIFVAGLGRGLTWSR